MFDSTKEFESWQLALSQEILQPEQLAVLQKMVDEEKAETLKDAAQLLDWQDKFMNAAEHMYGF